MLLSNKLILAGISFESSALAVLTQDIGAPMQLLGFITLHAIASAIIAQLYYCFYPPVSPAEMVSTGIVFSAGVFCTVDFNHYNDSGCARYPFFSKAAIYYPFVNVELPEFTQSNAGIRNSLGEGAIRTRLNNPNLSTEVRVKALLSAHAMSARYSVPMLKDLLGDEADDLRLLAYGMLDNREKTLNALIHELLIKLESCAQSALRQLYQKQLAELYWAFAYEHLAEGDMLAYMLTQAERYARAALEIKSDGDLWVLLAQILIKQQQNQKAEAAFEQALKLGMPVTRIQPYLAELAYQRHDYQAVRKHLQLIPFNNQIPQIANIQRFWLRTPA
jgi:hypothetical protein